VSEIKMGKMGERIKNAEWRETNKKFENVAEQNNTW
jgi:hypothetical protein